MIVSYMISLIVFGRFYIRCEIIFKSSLCHYSLNGKAFDAIAWDSSGEIKLVALNEQTNDSTILQC